MRPGTKFPGRYTAADGWWKAHDWQKYCDRLPTRFETEIWDRWPDAGVCLALGASSAPRGKILVAVDIDTDIPAESDAIRSVLPGSPVAKRGAKGETQFYLANPCVKNTPFNDANKRRLLDLLAQGRQTVMPPTIHPDTGAGYYWITPGTLELFDVADLPMLPDDIVERLAKALEPFGYVEPPKLGEGGNADLGIEAPHRALNDAALLNLDAWIPALSLYKCRKVGAAYKAVADWRPSSSGRPLAKRGTNLAIRHDGIKDCGENRGYTPLDLVMAATQCDLETAFRWLQERVAPARPILLLSNAPDGGAEANPILAKAKPTKAKPTLPSCEREEASIVRTSPKGNLAGLTLATVDGERVGNLPAVIPAAAIAVRESTPFDLESEPHLLGEIARFAHAAAFRPVEGFALPAALATLSVIFGRRFTTPTSLGLNVYCVAVADTGSGKEALLHGPKKLLAAAGLQHLLGPGDFTSDSAIEFSVRSRPCQLMLLDEFGKLAQAMMGRQSPVFAKLAAKALLELYSKSGPDNFWTGKQRADGLRDNAAEPVFSPTLSILGASTPAGFFEGINQDALEDGFLNRITLFPAGAMGRRQREAARLPVPAGLLEALWRAVEASNSGNLTDAMARDPSAKAQLRPVPFGDGAEAALCQVEDFEDELRAANRHGIGGRAAEQAQKFATLRALSRDPHTPSVSADDIWWAFGIVRRSIDAIERGAAEFMANTEFGALINSARKAIARGGEKGLTMRDLVRAPGVNGKETPKVEAALARLEMLREVGSHMPEGRGRPATRWRLLRPDEVELE